MALHVEYCVYVHAMHPVLLDNNAILFNSYHDRVPSDHIHDMHAMH